MIFGHSYMTATKCSKKHAVVVYMFSPSILIFINVSKIRAPYSSLRTSNSEEYLIVSIFSSILETSFIQRLSCLHPRLITLNIHKSGYSHDVIKFNFGFLTIFQHFWVNYKALIYKSAHQNCIIWIVNDSYRWVTFEEMNCSRKEARIFIRNN